AGPPGCARPAESALPAAFRGAPESPARSGIHHAFCLEKPPKHRGPLRLSEWVSFETLRLILSPNRINKSKSQYQYCSIDWIPIPGYTAVKPKTLTPSEFGDSGATGSKRMARCAGSPVDHGAGPVDRRMRTRRQGA